MPEPVLLGSKSNEFRPCYRLGISQFAKSRCSEQQHQLTSVPSRRSETSFGSKPGVFSTAAACSWGSMQAFSSRDPSTHETWSSLSLPENVSASCFGQCSATSNVEL